ncbi:MAG: hypothetical protein SF051_16405 [Elusimicrobiota bacterium]|nr:hypothetical protein [Elusimicrobiota bacterium]
MRGTRGLLALPLSAWLCAPAAAQLSVSPPPGWTDATPAARGDKLVATLKGPETSSFQVVRVTDVPLDNAGAVRLYLRDVLEGIRQGSRRDFKSDGRVERRSFRNGVVAHVLRADLDGKPRLAVCLAEAGGTVFVATLNSAAPEAMLPALMEAVTYPRVEGAVAETGTARSLDGQLEVALGGGLRARAPTDKERRDGFVLVMEGSGSELLFQRIEDDSTPVAEQAAIVRAAVAAVPGADPDSATPPEAAPTPAGPAAVYSWARLTEGAGGRVAVGFLPWGYWGYSLLARGPEADGLLTGVLAALKAGPNAVPRIVGATPVVPLEAEPLDRRVLLAAAGAAAVLLALLAAWSRSRKNATVSA